MTETCPLCGAELEPFEPLLPDTYTCPDCSYMTGDMENLISKSNMIYQVAEILVALLEDVKNINTDDELEEMEKEVERGRDLLKRLLEMEDKKIIPQEEEPTYPSPHKKPNPPTQPWTTPGDIYWQNTKSTNREIFFLDSGTGTTEALNGIESWLDELDNDED